MAYDVSNPPLSISQGIGGDCHRIYSYKSVDPATDVRAAGYFTNGWDLGMRAGDLVNVVDTDASPIALQVMIVSSASATGGVDLSDGTAIGATNT